MHYNVIVECIAQSDLDRRLNRSTEPSYLNDDIVDNVQVWNGTTLAAYSLIVNGASGDGSSFVEGSASSANLYGFEPMALKELGALIPDLVLVKVSSGGSRLGVTGNNNANGSWNPDYSAINTDDPTTPKLLQLFETRFDAFHAWTVSNSHTYTIVLAICHQGHADDPTPYNYETDWPLAIAELRSIVGVPTLPVLYGTIPNLSSQSNKKIRQVHLDYAADPDNNAYCFDAANGDLSTTDVTHMGHIVSGYFRDWIVSTYLKIVTPPVPAEQPSNRNIFTSRLSLSGKYDSVGRLIEKIGSLNSTQITSLRALETALKNGGIWDKYAAIWICIWGSADLNKYDLKNPDRPALSFTNITHGADGLSFNGTTSEVNPRVRLTDFPMLKTNDFGFGWYQQNNRLNTDEVVVAIPSNGSSTGVLRVFPSRTGSSNRMRVDIGSSTFDLQTEVIIDTRGSASVQSNGTVVQAHRRGILRGQKAYTADVDVNGYLIVGYDAFGGGRYFNGKISAFWLRKSFTLEEIQIENDAFQAFHVANGQAQVVLEPPFPAQYSDVIAAATADEVTLPTSTIQQYQQELMDDLAPYIDRIDVLRVYAGDDLTDPFSLYNFVRPSNKATVQGGMVDRTVAGWKGDNAATYLNQQHNLAIDSINYLQDSASHIIFVTEAQSASGAALFGCASSSVNRMFNSAGAHRLNSVVALNASADLSGAGYRAASRNDNTNVELYSDLTRFARTAASAPPASENILTLRSSSSYSNARVAVEIIAGYFNQTEHAGIRTAIRSYLTKLGVSV